MALQDLFGVEELTDERDAKERFRIIDKSQACWALRKLKKLIDEQSGNKTLAEKEIQRISDWLESENGKLQKSIDFFKGLLEYYFRNVVLAEDPKLKTLSLPYGKLKIRDQTPEFKYDEDTLLKWVRQNSPEMLEFNPKVNKTALKKEAEIVEDKLVFKKTGEIIDGVKVEKRLPKFTVDVI